MEFSTKAGTLENLKSGCLVVGVYADRKLSPSAGTIDAASNGALSRAIENGDQTGKRATTSLLSSVAGIQADRVLLVGLGPQDELDDRNYAEVVRAAVKALAATGAADAVFTLPEATVRGRSLSENVRIAIVLAREANYRFDQLKSKKELAPPLSRLDFPRDETTGAANIEASVSESISAGIALANGIDLAKTLGNLPPNICTPTYLAETAKKLAHDFSDANDATGEGERRGHFKLEVLERKQMEALKMGALLAVAKGSTEAPKLIVLKYHGADAKEAPVVLVGKGITFDSGGISLKPGEAMDEMKYDMCGAASVLGSLRAIAEMNLKINVVGIIPTCENMPAGDAAKPGDVVTSMSGQTIEILNTDAEGRLILCDALTYAERFAPAAVIDIATLTGACVIALGHINSGLFTADDELAAELLAASKSAADPLWRMPLQEDYQEQLKSNFADMANIGGRPGGSITAACFLWRYTKNYRWAHLDIAGTAWKSGAAKGATGRPVALLTEFLKKRTQ